VCYHTSLARTADYLEKRFQAKFEQPNLFEPIYHSSGFSAPHHPVISNEAVDSIQFFKWGLIPFWTKDETAAERIRTSTLNARAETIHKKPSFRASIMTKRCLVLVDGFYEWREEGRKKCPYYITLAGNDAFALAGIWDTWLNESTGEVRNTFSIITTTANPLLERIHNTRKRMPVILRREDEKEYLDMSLHAGEIDALLQPYDENEMQAHTVSRLISTKMANPNVPEVMKAFKLFELERLAACTYPTVSAPQKEEAGCGQNGGVRGCDNEISANAPASRQWYNSSSDWCIRRATHFPSSRPVTDPRLAGTGASTARLSRVENQLWSGWNKVIWIQP